MKKIVFLAILLTALTADLYSQCESFTVYRTKGDVRFTRGSASWAPVKNTELTRDISLVIGNDAYIILLSGQDKALRLTTPGTYSSLKIKSVCQQNQTSLTKEYLNYVAQSIIEKEEPKTAMVIKGAVYRSKTEFGANVAMVLPCDSSVITSDEITFAWKQPSDNTPQYIHIYENGVKRVYSRQMADTTVTVFAGLFKANKIYFWLVSPVKEPTDMEPRFTFVNAPNDWKTEMLSDTTGFMREMEGDVETMMKKLQEVDQENK